MASTAAAAVVRRPRNAAEFVALNRLTAGNKMVYTHPVSGTLTGCFFMDKPLMQNARWVASRSGISA
ncbi:peptidase [Edwardsiella piscicida]|nr:putative iron-regulated membrane protein [Edwardsiella piscicida]GBK55509.1 peptidase [Edwardsiella piscicida]GBK58190.1 peptidase [Edwardsiella piscicida]